MGVGVPSSSENRKKGGGYFNYLFVSITNDKRYIDTSTAESEESDLKLEQKAITSLAEAQVVPSTDNTVTERIDSNSDNEDDIEAIVAELMDEITIPDETKEIDDPLSLQTTEENILEDIANSNERLNKLSMTDDLPVDDRRNEIALDKALHTQTIRSYNEEILSSRLIRWMLQVLTFSLIWFLLGNFFYTLYALELPALLFSGSQVLLTELVVGMVAASACAVFLSLYHAINYMFDLDQKPCTGNKPMFKVTPMYRPVQRKNLG